MTEVPLRADGAPYDTITVSGTAVIEDIVAIAEGARVLVPRGCLEALAHAKAGADELSRRRHVYGRSTGVGANRTVVVTAADRHGVDLIRSHAADAGAPLPERAVRAMLATRLNQLCVPGSGIAPEVVAALAAMLNADAMPTIREFGAIGTGDLTALAAAGLALAGERPTSKPLPSIVTWDSANALPFLSSSALTVARVSLAENRLRRLDRAGRRLFAVACACLNGNPEAFSPTAAEAIAAPGAVEVCAEIRSLMDGWEFAPARIQDPYALRVYPVVQAAFSVSLGRLRAQTSRLLGTAQENPRYDVDAGLVAHHGGFYQAQLALDIDAMNLAVGQSASMAHAALRMMNEPAYTGLQPFLAEGYSASSGLMMLEYTAAGALAEIRNAGAPASAGAAVLSRGTEEDAGFATQGVVQLERAVHAFTVVLACELVAVARLGAQRGMQLPPAMERFRAALSSVAPDGEGDLRDALERAEHVLDALGGPVG